MKILAIDTSCDETAVAVTRGTTVLSNVIWSQASQHANFGGVMPSLAQRMHEERINWVINKAMKNAQCTMNNLGAIAVTAGPGLAIALGVGIAKARELAEKYKLPLIPINHTEGHLLSPLARPNTSPLLFPSPELGEGLGVRWPALGLVVSGGHTELVLIKKIGEYQILAKTQDDALGEALDKAARMLGLGYPGGAVLEKMARLGNPKAYTLPLPMARREDQNSFSYSGLKTAFYRLTEEVKVKSNPTSHKASLGAQQIYDLAASFQNRAFQHLERVCMRVIYDSGFMNYDLLAGGGVVANIALRKRLRKMGRELNLKVRFPYSAKLIGDNAAMIGVAAYLKIKNQKSKIKYFNYRQVDRRPRWSVEEPYPL